MKYTITDLESFMAIIQAEEKAIRADRGKRYGTKEDTLANVAEFGSDGAIVSMWECVMRIRNMFGKPKDIKDLANAVQDLRNFAAYALCLETRTGQMSDSIGQLKPTGVVPWSEQIHKEIDDMYDPESEFSKERLDPLRDTTNTETGD